MNVLLTSAGRRTSLASAFKAALASRGGRLICSDLDPIAPTLFLADAARRLPHVRDAAYSDAIRTLVEAEDVEIVVPTIDTELPTLARLAPALAERGCVVAGSTPEFVALCSDKWATATRFGEHGIVVPRSALPGTDISSLGEKLFIKPRGGSASQGATPCTPAEVAALVARTVAPIIQERLEGREITVDALLSLRGEPLHYVPRHRIKTVGGESFEGVTIDDGAGLREVLLRTLSVCAALGARGPITLQFFETAAGLVLSEINPRFGGGFPLAQAAGGHYPAWLIAMAAGEPCPARLGLYERGVYMTRYPAEIFTREPKW